LLAVDFQVEQGLIVLFGPSGCGKSTVLNCIAGLLKPEAGFIKIGGQVFYDCQSGVNLCPQDRQLGYVFQHSALFPHLNVKDNICFGISNWPLSRKEERLEVLLNLLELNGLSQRTISQLSGGQIQRVALARALAREPGVLLLDEPFTALDYELRTQLGQELKALQRRLQIPMLMVTHSLPEARDLADQVVSMKDGRVVDAGAPGLVLASAGSN